MVSILTCPSNSYFNPRSREGSDIYIDATGIVATISIHAPARGATLFRNVMQLETQISIHAPVRGATVKELCEIVWGEFQSTLPRGERRVFLCHVTDNRSISIHAPARGATKQAAAPFRNCSYFNPRSREWSDGNDGTNGKDGKDFNPRSREWSDARGRGGGAAEGISIHAPASGATGDEYLELLPESISIHAPASGATVIRTRHGDVVSISIHAPASGATAFIDIFSFTVRLYFISSH